MEIRIGNAAGFFGDDIDAPRRLVQDPASQLDVLTLEYLAELTMSILALQKRRDPSRGYAGDFLTILESIADELSQQPQLKIVTNGGGLNPAGCAKAAATRLQAAVGDDVPLAVVTGDDLLERFESLLAAGHSFPHLDTGQPFAELGVDPVSVNAYLGAEPIVQALAADARFVITGRVADAALTLAPAMHAFGWRSDDWDRLAGASVAGHLIECGAQVTGGYTTRWDEWDFREMPYPVATVDDAGNCTIEKAGGRGGRVDRLTVTEQLIYEIGDPARYMTPDVVVDFTSVQVSESALNTVRVTNARGQKAPNEYKVTMAYPAGFTTSAQLVVYGANARTKAERVANLVWERLEDQGITFAERNQEFLGANDGVPRDSASGSEEIVLRMSVRDASEPSVRRFTQEIAPLITNGPAGLAGYAAARGRVRPVFAYWPSTIPKEAVPHHVDVRSIGAWLE